MQVADLKVGVLYEFDKLTDEYIAAARRRSLGVYNPGSVSILHTALRFIKDSGITQFRPVTINLDYDVGRRGSAPVLRNIATIELVEDTTVKTFPNPHFDPRGPPQIPIQIEALPNIRGVFQHMLEQKQSSQRTALAQRALEDARGGPINPTAPANRALAQMMGVPPPTQSPSSALNWQKKPLGPLREGETAKSWNLFAGRKKRKTRRRRSQYRSGPSTYRR